eukprot:scaffold82474_cov18-Tisochrysis_lutea.AAC.2
MEEACRRDNGGGLQPFDTSHRVSQMRVHILQEKAASEMRRLGKEIYHADLRCGFGVILERPCRVEGRNGTCGRLSVVQLELDAPKAGFCFNWEQNFTIHYEGVLSFE